MPATGVEPRIMGFAPAPATRKILARTGMSLDQMVDLIRELRSSAATPGG